MSVLNSSPSTGTSPVPTVTFRWLPVLAVALSTFSVVTAEMMPVGLLTPIAAEFGVNPGIAGTSLTITGITAAVIAPLTPVLAGRIDRRTLLVGFLALLAVANMMSALADAFVVFAIARVLIGVSMGVVWALAGGLGPRLADPTTIGRAMTTIFSGVSIGLVLGLPLGTFIANLSGWRAAFWALAGLGVGATAFALAVMPRLPVTEPARFAGMFAPWRDRGVRAGFLITAFVVIGQFMAYTYIRPTLESGGAITPTAIVIALAVYGLAGIGGNFLIGAVAANRPRLALLLALAAIVLGILLITVAVMSIWTALIVLVVWGAAYGGIGVASQAWIRVANPHIVERSSAMWSGVFNAAIAAGALAGGVILDVSGALPLMLTAALVVAVGWLVTVVARPDSWMRP